MTDSPLSGLAPYPAPLELDSDYARHAPTPAALRAQLARVAAAQDWAGSTWPQLITGLLALGRTDVPLSRLAEGHIDALRILDQADRKPEPDALYGVWASRSQRTGLSADRVEGGLVLDGTIRFASGAGVLDRALVPVWLSSEEHLLIDLAVAELPVDTGDWSTTAMEVSRSHTVPIRQLRVEAELQIGPQNFYLARPGFFPGGVGVAACWAGGAARIADLTRLRLREPASPLQLRLGRIRTALAAAGAVVLAAAQRLEGLLADPESDPSLLQVLSTEARAAVAGAVDTVLSEVQRIAGPAGLAYDADLTRAIHDLQLYVLQQNADADDGFLGGFVDAP
ncbi:MAG TPA: hypothetical protein VIT42_17080 [Microlunatus sp.]